MPAYVVVFEGHEVSYHDNGMESYFTLRNSQSVDSLAEAQKRANQYGFMEDAYVQTHCEMTGHFDFRPMHLLLENNGLAYKAKREQCSMAEKCNRNPLSGTVPESKRQSWFDAPPVTETGCNHWMPVERQPKQIFKERWK